ncbi:MAG: MurR/RpiR family transcriptional regulator [Tissierellia bacterium]|nr:MurR/RpiR family transcriptional regulator [Tissierellia bacterium]
MYKIILNQTALTKSEMLIMKYIQDNIDNLDQLSINDIAKNTFSSISSVSRAVKKSGYKGGLSELRFRIHEQINNKNNKELIYQIMQKSLLETKQTFDNLEHDQILNFIKLVMSSPKIFVISNAITNFCSGEFELRMNILGFNTFHISDLNIDMKINALIKKNDLLVIFSLNENADTMYKAAKLAKNKNAKIAAITCNKNAKFLQFCDVSLIGSKIGVRRFNKIDIASRIPLYNISRIITDYLRYEIEKNDNN